RRARDGAPDPRQGQRDRLRRHHRDQAVRTQGAQTRGPAAGRGAELHHLWGSPDDGRALPAGREGVPHFPRQLRSKAGVRGGRGRVAGPWTGGTPPPTRRASAGGTAAPRNRRKAAGEESPGSMDIRCRIMSGGGDPRESATEKRPPAAASATTGKGETVR